jgi:hypothetical protein
VSTHIAVTVISYPVDINIKEDEEAKIFFQCPNGVRFEDFCR